MNGDLTLQFLQLRRQGVHLAEQMQMGRDQNEADLNARLQTVADRLVTQHQRIEREIEAIVNEAAAAPDLGTIVEEERILAARQVAQARVFQESLQRELQKSNDALRKRQENIQLLQKELTGLQKVLKEPDPGQLESFAIEYSRMAIRQMGGKNKS